MKKQSAQKVLRSRYLDVGQKALMSTGVSAEHAEMQMRSLLESDLRGVFSHGIFRLPRYLEQLKHRYINPAPNIAAIRQSPTVEVLDADHALGAVAGTIAMRKAIAQSKAYGVGVVGCRKSNHFGRAAYYAEMAAAEKQIGLVLTNSSPIIAPTGSIQPLIGNNPWSVSVPTWENPITLDLANTIVSKGKIRMALKNGEPIPPGWALDGKGNPTIDPAEALKGTVLPIGGYKGYGIAFMAEILSAVLTGADFSVNLADHDADAKRNVGHLFISLNVRHFMELEEFYARVGEFAQIVKQAPKVREDQDIFLPGEKEWRHRQAQDREHVVLSAESFQVFAELSQALE